MYKNFRRLFGVYKYSNRPLVFSQLFLLISVILNLIIISLNGRLVNEGVVMGNVDVVVTIALWMIGLTLLQAVFTIGNVIYAVMLSEGTANYLRIQTYRKIQNLSFGNLDRFHTSDLLVRLTSDINNIKLATLYGFMQALSAPFTVVITLIITFIGIPDLAWQMLLSMVIISIVLLLLLHGLQNMYSTRQAKLDSVNMVLQESLAGVRVVKAFIREGYESQRFDKAAKDLQTASLGPAYRIAFFLPAAMSLVYFAVAAMGYIGGKMMIIDHTVNLGQLVVFIDLLVAAIVPIAILAFMIPYFEAGEASLQRLFEVLDETPEVQVRPDIKPIDLSKIKGKISFDNVSFGYRKKDGLPMALALKDINLAIKPGETVGFLGATGSGKSTLVNLLPRFYDVVNGRVTIDDIDVRDIPQRQLCDIIGIALQDAVLFSGTVRSNILFSRPDLDDDQMLVASKSAEADGFVDRIPEKYDSRVSRRGANFSGGQRQRLSIARAVVGSPKILILDDSTSALDLATEARVQEAVGRNLKDTTKLYVAQRISTVLTADKIVLLDEGRQVAVGRHDDLLQTSPLYREIYESQLGRIDTPPISSGISHGNGSASTIKGGTA